MGATLENSLMADNACQGPSFSRQEDLFMEGKVEWRVIDGKTGQTKIDPLTGKKMEGETHNIITNAGKAAVAKLTGSGLGGTAFLAQAIGTSATAPAATDTTLTAEITTNGGARGASDTITQVTTTVTNDTTQFVKTWTFIGGFTVQETGILNNSSSGGDLLAHALIGPTTVVSGDSLQVTHKVKQG